MRWMSTRKTGGVEGRVEDMARECRGVGPAVREESTSSSS